MSDNMIDKFKTDIARPNHISEKPRYKLMRELRMANVIGMYSKDPSTQVGAVLVPPDISQRYTGYNGFKPGVDDDPGDLQNREVKYKKVVHGEVNAIRKAIRTGESIIGWYLFVNCPPCATCAELIAGKKIGHVVYLDREMSETFEAEKGKAIDIMEKAGVEVIAIDPKEYLEWLQENPINPLVNGKSFDINQI